MQDSKHIHLFWIWFYWRKRNLLHEVGPISSHENIVEAKKLREIEQAKTELQTQRSRITDSEIGRQSEALKEEAMGNDRRRA